MQLRRIGMVLLLATFLLVPSISSAQPSAEVVWPPLGTAAEGRIEPAGEVSICQQGATHLLVNEAGEVIYQLKSNTVNLAQYEGQRVRVVGTVGVALEGCPPVLTVLLVVPEGGYPGSGG
ncbi:MAG: hypothetical protein M3437_02285 [Chloroflexota bacterium]|nr:hypothetical protein [Chloroflexota bacterium]